MAAHPKGDWYPKVHYPPCGGSWYGYPAWVTCRDKSVGRELQSDMWKIYGWCAPTYDGKNALRGREGAITKFKFSETSAGVVTVVTLRALITPYKAREGDGLVFKDATWSDMRYNPRTKHHDLIATGACGWQTLFKRESDLETGIKEQDLN